MIASKTIVSLYGGTLGYANCVSFPKFYLRAAHASRDTVTYENFARCADEISAMVKDLP